MNVWAIVTKDTRNAQCGDWEFDAKDLVVKSLPLGDWRYELLIQVHELVEAALCKHRGITDEEVTDFDALFEEEREMGMHSKTAEDGDDPRAPYRQEHFTATNIERILAQELEVDWLQYEKAIYDATN
jgi:hypothetical protein